MTVTDFRGKLGEPNARVATTLHVDAFWDLLIDAIDRVGSSATRS
jgi:inosine-uridine nucleoside N-ribohydrolase